MAVIQKAVYDAIRTALSEKEPECGGVLGAVPGEAISKFYFDVSGKSTQNAYTPDYETINAVLEEWAAEGVQMVGMIHSHADGSFPSCGDLFYCHQILLGNPAIKEFLLPIATLNPFTIHMFRVLLDENLHILKDDIEIL